MTADLPQLVSAATIAHRLDVSMSSVRKWAREGRLGEPVPVGRAVRYRVSDVRQFIQLPKPKEGDIL